jgi:hypothetical protein
MSTTLTTLAPLRADTNADNDPDSIAALRAQIEALDQKVRILQRKDEISQDETATKLKSLPTVTVDDQGLTAESADKAYKIRFDGFIQTQYRAFINDNKVNDGFDIRRMRPTVSGTLDNNLDYFLQPELPAGKCQAAVPAFADWNWLFRRALFSSRTTFLAEQRRSNVRRLDLRRSTLLTTK